MFKISTLSTLTTDFQYNLLFSINFPCFWPHVSLVTFFKRILLHSMGNCMDRKGLLAELIVVCSLANYFVTERMLSGTRWKLWVPVGLGCTDTHSALEYSGLLSLAPPRRPLLQPAYLHRQGSFLKENQQIEINVK